MRFTEVSMDLDMINNLIEELEKSEMSLSNIRNLSALYTVRNQLLDKSQEKVTQDIVTDEIDDILPSYLQYVDIKRKYQFGNESKDNVLTYLKSVCSEIKDLVHVLYSGTDMPEERQLIQKMVKEMQ